MSQADQSIRQIKEMCIPHRNYERALAEAAGALVASAPGEVICIMGPSRVGKSRLVQALNQLVIGTQPLAEGFMPVVSVQAENCSVGGSFSTKAFTLRALEAIHHPFYAIGENNGRLENDRNRLAERTPEGILRVALERGLVCRKTQFFIVDEAQHIRYARGGDRAAAAVLDSWKCLAAETGVVLILVGAYPLIDVLRLCPHLLGRKHQVHFPRYQNNREDLFVFEQILDAYTPLIRLPNEIGSLRAWNDLFYADSFGCIGLVSSWLRGALGIMRSRGELLLRREHLIAARRSLEDRRQLAQEIADGERVLNAATDDNFVPAPRPAATHNRPKRKPFQKKPRRYAVAGRA